MSTSSSMGLRLPVQGAVDRAAMPLPAAGAKASAMGVDASQINWGSVGQTLLQNLPGIISGIASFL